jgi:hypothetical protein
MADSFIQVPADGAGKKVYAQDTGDGFLKQGVILLPGAMPHGCAIYHVVSAGTTNGASVKASPGQVYGWRVYNNAGYPVYVKLHNTAGSPTPGAGVIQTIGFEAGLPDGEFIPVGIAFSVGIGISIVKGIADSDATAVALNDCVVDLFYA